MATGFGRDLHCYDRLFTGRIASRAELVAQAIFRRLNTARGTLRDGEEGALYGFDILDFVGSVGTAIAVDALPGAIESEVKKDDRVASCKAEATVQTASDGTSTIILDVNCTLADEDQDFALTLSISDVGVQLLGTTVA